MKKITAITKEQEAQLPIVVDRWVEHASSPVDFLKAKSAIERFYAYMGKSKPTVLMANGPVDAFWSAVAVQLLCGDKKAIETLFSTLDSTLFSTLDSSLESTLFSTLGSTLGSTLFSTLFSTLDSTLRS